MQPMGTGAGSSNSQEDYREMGEEQGDSEGCIWEYGEIKAASTEG